MRVLLKKSSSTKAERIFAEILKRNHIKFQYRVKLEGREIDFVIGKYAVEIDGHDQSTEKNQWLVKKGFTPLHLTNRILQKFPKLVEESIIEKKYEF